MEFVYKLVKYFTCGVFVFFILKYVAKDKLTTIDIGLISTIAMLIFAIIDNVQENVSPLFVDDNSVRCNSYCAIRENMDNIENMGNIASQKEEIELKSNLSASTGATNSASTGATNSASTGATNSASTGTTNSANVNASTNVNASIETKTESIKQNNTNTDYKKMRDENDKREQTQATYNKNYVTTSDRIARQANGAYTVNLYKNDQSPKVGSRPENDIVSNEIKYNYTDYSTLPPNLNEGTFEHGYSFLPPEKWYPQPPHPPVCVAEKRCEVCPLFSSGNFIDLKEWNSARRVMPPDDINVNYVKEKLNSGR